MWVLIDGGHVSMIARLILSNAKPTENEPSPLIVAQGYPVLCVSEAETSKGSDFRMSMTLYSSLPPSMESRDGFTFADLELRHRGWMNADHHHGRVLDMTIEDGPCHFPF